MSADGTDNADTPSPIDRKDGDVKEVLFAPTASVSASSTSSGTDAGDSTEEVARVSNPDGYGPVEALILEAEGSVVVNLPKEDGVVADANEGATENENPPKVDLISPKIEHKRVGSAIGDYDSMLFEFDRFAYKGGGETVGYGYAIEDMVWGKVKSHPWWPGQIFNEVLASPAVRRTKRSDGHVLVAFFGDCSYGWFDPAELIPFVESFMEKSRQSTSRAFVKAVEEAVYELSRRKCLGLACRCRNEFNFWPFSVEGYFTVYSGDYEPGVYSLTEINRAREEFRPKEMLSFVQQLALRPRDNDSHWSIEFLRSKATVLACRKAFYEEYDETYAQAFGSTSGRERPARPTAPVVVDPSGVSLSGPLVFAEDLGKGKLLMTPSEMKDELEKERYMFKRRDEPAIMKPKKALGQVARSILVDGRVQQQYSVSGENSFPTQVQSGDAYNVFGDMGSGKLLEGGKKKFKLLNPNALKTSDMHAVLGEQKMKRMKEAGSQGPSPDPNAAKLALIKKKRKREMIRGIPYPQSTKSNIGIAKQQAPRMPQNGPDSVSNNQTENQQKHVVMLSSLSSIGSQQEVEIRNLELPLLVRDLRALALNPFHGMERGCPALSWQAVLKYRSLVYQKSLVLSPPAETETTESHLAALPASCALQNPASKSRDKSSVKLLRPSMRPDDLTRGGTKRIQPDHSAIIKKRKVAGLEADNMKRMMNDSKLSAKIRQKSAVLLRKEATSKNVPPKLLKPSKSDSSSSRGEKPVKARHRTALMMKFPKGASLPSGAELAAKFARFGPLEFTSTRVFWQTETCRLVFQHKVDAEAALKFAASTENLFGYANVFCHLKDASSSSSSTTEPTDTKAAKVWKEDTSQELVPRSSPKPPVPLKSCLKKQPNGENGGGNGRGTRVKFVLVGDGSPSTEQNSITPTSTHSSNSLDFTTTTTKSFVAKLNRQTPKASSSLMPSTSSSSGEDISMQFLSLLNRCKDVVTNVAGALGYAPYHAL